MSFELCFERILLKCFKQSNEFRFKISTSRDTFFIFPFEFIISYKFDRYPDPSAEHPAFLKKLYLLYNSPQLLSLFQQTCNDAFQSFVYELYQENVLFLHRLMQRSFLTDFL